MNRDQLPIDVHRVGCQALSDAFNMGINKDNDAFSLDWIKSVEDDIEAFRAAGIRELAEEIKGMAGDMPFTQVNSDVVHADEIDRLIADIDAAVARLLEGKAE